MTFRFEPAYDRVMRRPLQTRRIGVCGFVGATSLVLCLLVAGLWMRSTTEMDQVRTADPAAADDAGFGQRRILR